MTEPQPPPPRRKVKPGVYKSYGAMLRGLGLLLLASVIVYWVIANLLYRLWKAFS